MEEPARQVQELQWLLDLTYAELSEYRKGGHHQGGPERPVRWLEVAPSAAHQAAPRVTAAQHYGWCRWVNDHNENVDWYSHVRPCTCQGVIPLPCARTDGLPRRPQRTTGPGHKELALCVDHGQPWHGTASREQLPGLPHLRGPAPAAST